jgi:hypothetical protein
MDHKKTLFNCLVPLKLSKKFIISEILQINAFRMGMD